MRPHLGWQFITFLIIGLVLFGIVLLDFGRISRTVAATPVTILQPSSSFQLQGTDRFRMNDFVVHSNALYFLLSSQSGEAEVLVTTPTGEPMRTVVLPPTSRGVRRLRIDQNGNIAVLIKRGHDPDTVIICDGNDGRVTQTIKAEAPINDLVFVDGKLQALTDSSLIQLAPQPLHIGGSGIHPPMMMAALPNNRLALVDIVLGHVSIVSAGSALPLLTPGVLTSPEVQGVERPKVESSEGWTAIVSTVASNDTGELYLGITGGKRQEGAPVLVLNQDGVLIHRLRCILPTFGGDPSHHQSYMYPGRLAAGAKTLYWLSLSEKKVAQYVVE